MTQEHRRGPRAGRPDLRQAILAAARSRFIEHGFRATTLRQVAADTGCDVSLIAYYFGSKEQLFLLAMEVTVSPRAAFAEVLEAGLDGAGERLVRTALLLWQGEPAAQSLRQLLAHISTRDDMGAVLRDYFEHDLYDEFAKTLGGPDARYRASLLASHMIGLIILRRVVGVEALAQAEVDRIVADVGPVVQRYLVGPLPSAARSPRGRPIR